MLSSSWLGAGGDSGFKVLWEDGDRVFCRRESHAEGYPATVLVVLPAAEHPTPATLDRLACEYGLKDELDGAWAVRPLAFVHERGRSMLVLEDTGSESLDRVFGAPMEVQSFLRLAITVAAALGQVHRRGLVHKDIKPANILVNLTNGEVKLTGFGLASRLRRERQAPAPPESIAGTLAYMAPEQTGRMNRSIDSRSDLYSLGVVFYQMLTGSLPFTAANPMEWVHCHIARRPAPPSERVHTVPAQISALIMKLLAKTAEERYQTAAGLERDLQHCLAAWGTRRRIDAFPLGRQDTPNRLFIPEKLYGREREIEALVAAFDRVVASGRPELVLVSGYSGIGKSVVVNELHRALVPTRGLFATGKFDQYKREIPYATLAQAFQGLIRPLVGKSDAELAGWRDALREALEPNGRLMIDLVPELKLLIGEQPPVADLPPQQAQSRLQLVFQRFLGVFARPEHPLTLFLDDLQWLDAATLDVLAALLIQVDVKRLLVIGAYRDNEVDSAHPLTRKLDAIREAGAVVEEISLAPLARKDLGRLIADTLSCTQRRAAPLARLVHEKTGGNPFFMIQFLSALSEEGLLRFDHDAARWSWELDRLHAKQYTDNVVDLMVGKLTRLPAETQAALQQLACLGNLGGIAILSSVIGKSNEDVRSELWHALRLELVEHLGDSYKFIHDRVQEAAYSLIPEQLRAEAHLRIGRALVAHTPPEKREEAVFEIVNQLNRGCALITSRVEREQLAELNLLAGQRAKASAAYVSALPYLTAGAAVLPDDSWERRHELAFSLELYRGECEFLTGALAESEQRLAALSTRVANTVERATVACLRVDLYTTLDQSDRAVCVFIDDLRHLGIEWSPHPTDEEVRREYERIWSDLGDRPIEAVVELPLMSDPTSLATLDVLTKVAPAALFTDANLLPLAICRAVNLSLEFGNSDGSCFAYVWLGMLAGPYFNNYDAGFQFGRLGYELVEKRGLRRFQARTYMCFGNLVMPWTRHVEAGRDLVRRAFDAASRIGDLTFAAYSCNNLNTNLLATGETLSNVEREVENGLDFARKARFGLVIDIISAQLALIRTLRGLTSKFGSFDDRHFDENRFERRLASAPVLALPECWYWIRKLQARFFAEDYPSAIEASLHAKQLIWTSPSFFEIAEYQFYGALSRAASCESATTGERRLHVEALVAHHRQLEIWAASCPENFENRAALVGAEVARIESRELDAERLYEQAIRSARANRFVHNEAIAYERASAFYRARGFDQIAELYLRNARYGYLRWGADGKVRQLEEKYPHLRTEEQAPGPTTTIGASVEHLDLATVIKISQAVSSEMVIENLLDTLMRTAIEQAGAERGLLILPSGSEQRIAAEVTTGGEAVVVHLHDEPVTAAVMPETVLHYVLRTGESIILDDAAIEPSFSADSYIRQHQARSILCLPLINRARLIGVLYLENNLTTRAFAPTRIAVLKLLASEAATALENTRLYRDLEQREAKIRGLVDANIIGIGIGDRDGRMIEANEAYLRIIGYDRDDLVAGRINWMDLTPPEWRSRSPQALSDLATSGAAQPFEKEYFRKDGSRVPVLIGIAGIEGTERQTVSFVLDLTERKRAEQALHEGEARIRGLFDANIIGIFIGENEGPVREANDAFLGPLGYDRDDLEGGRIHRTRVTPPEWRARNARARAELTTLGSIQPFEEEFLRKDGSRIPVLVGAAALDRDRVVGFVLDLRERKRAEAEARESERRYREIQEQFAHANRVATMGQLTASIAHEVSQPIAATVIGAQAGLLWLAARPPDLEEVRQNLAAIVESGNRAGDVIGRIRALVKKAPRGRIGWRSMERSAR